ncbi:MAG: isoprenoid biosynthesis glyoxalase ElbB [Bacteroidales bacterium]|nr:isoprenoid biosynthesis glyoxalase ElbB [Bacteroidales bacterium]MCF8351077.1 isoprenoid biosynthesis glyoxalase ElbB [Bacteroidales bacterium]MCF8377391.1 isoprenoid biosynthesis glyoxalase ElbB [Bacteroidales bacterium]MCF8401330.1 isoprenoid biosynthesis glyoxalase ElbB [Bacteroidales bacterium]
MKKFAVVLAGCGVYDGAEIHEAILAMLAIKRQGGEYQCFAPDIPQHHVINHLTGEEANEQRNVLVESARIARGEIKSLSDYKVEDYDALIFPGGFGAAKNLSTVAFDGADAKVNPEVKRVVEETHQAKKPIGALCITPAFIAKIIEGVNVTVGDDEGTIKAIEKMAGKHVKTTHGDVVVDEDNMVFTTPCYMLDAQITDIDDGASNIVAEMMKYM